MKTLKEVIFEELKIKESFEIPTKLLEKLLSEEKDDFLSKIKEVYNFEEDSLRDFFQAEQSSRKDLMQDYTPDCICKIISGITESKEDILDICSGTGALTIAGIKDTTEYIQCEELSSASIPYLLLNLSLRNLTAKVYQKDVITKDIKKTYKLEKGAEFSNISVIDELPKDKFDLIISNPPYSLPYEPDKDDTRLVGYEAPPKSKADYLFVLDALERLNNTGKAFFILPHGVLFRGSQEAKIRQKLIENNLIESIIGLPDKLFMNTDISTVIIVLNKAKKDTNVLFINGAKLFQKAKSKNIITDEQIKQFVDTYKNQENIDFFSKIVTQEELKENDFNLNIPRYVCEKFEEKDIDLDKVLNDLQKIDKETQVHANELRDLVGQLEYRNDDGTKNKEKTEWYINNSLQMIDIFEGSTRYNELEQIIHSMNNFGSEVSDYEIRTLTDMVSIERAKKRKVYKAGSITIQMSATKGQMDYLFFDQEVDTYKAVMEITTDDINSYYLYNILQEDTERFLKNYQTGLNITTDIFKFWKVPIHNDINIQNQFAKALFNLNQMIEKEEKATDFYKDYKEFNLQKMLV